LTGSSADFSAIDLRATELGANASGAFDTGAMSPIFLQAPAGPNPLEALFPIAAIMVIFYLLIFRPQQKRQKEHEKMLKSIVKGDRIVTSGGIHGEVTGASEEILTVEIANLKGERLRVKVDRARVDRRVARSEEGGE
jgi:preprotein translocase subunit YajC